MIRFTMAIDRKQKESSIEIYAEDTNMTGIKYHRQVGCYGYILRVYLIRWCLQTNIVKNL
jgi:hypothetical protein